MVFSCNVFLFLFLPMFLAIYYRSPNRGRLRNYVVLIGSYAFYAWWRVDFLVLFAGVTVWNYFVGMGIARAKASAALDKVSAAVIARRWLIAGVVVDLATLAYFKYANFGVGSFNEMLQSRSEEHTSELQSLMRISYAVFCLKKQNSNNIHVSNI